MARKTSPAPKGREPVASSEGWLRKDELPSDFGTTTPFDDGYDEDEFIETEVAPKAAKKKGPAKAAPPPPESEVQTVKMVISDEGEAPERRVSPFGSLTAIVQILFASGVMLVGMGGLLFLLRTSG